MVLILKLLAMTEKHHLIRQELHLRSGYCCTRQTEMLILLLLGDQQAVLTVVCQVLIADFFFVESSHTLGVVSTLLAHSSRTPDWVFQVQVLTGAIGLITAFGAILMGRQSSQKLAVLKFSRGLGWVSNFNKLINWHHHMKDHVEIGHLAMYDAFRTNKYYATNPEIYGSKSIRMSLILRQRPQII